MKLKLILLYLIISLLLTACDSGRDNAPKSTPTVTAMLISTPSALPSTFTPTPTPCNEPVTPIAIGTLSLYLHCEVRDPELIVRVLTFIEALQPVTADYHVFAQKDKKQADQLGQDWINANVHNNSVEIVSFGRGGGRGWPGLAIVYQGDYWSSFNKKFQGYLIAHEYHHLVQFELSGVTYGQAQLPAWFEEGFAYLWAEQQMVTLDGKSGYIAYGCETIPPLSTLVSWSTVQDDACPYVAGYEAAKKMLHARGWDGYFKLLGIIYSEVTFDSAFKQVYGISTTEFYNNTDLPTP